MKKCTKRVFFLDGDIIFATSTDRAESLGDFLVGTTSITEDQLRVSSGRAQTQTPGARHGEILVRMGFVDKDDLGSAVRKQVQAILWSLFNWDEGKVSFRGWPRKRRRGIQDQDSRRPRHHLPVAGELRIRRRSRREWVVEEAVFKRLPMSSHLEDFRSSLTSSSCWTWWTASGRFTSCAKSGAASPGANIRVSVCLVRAAIRVGRSFCEREDPDTSPG